MNNLIMQFKINGEGKPLLLVPGGLTGWQSWEPYVGFFTGKNRKVIRVQLLNVQYGLENRPLPSDYSVKTESKALHATLDLSGISTPIDIVAWSFGAFSSLDFALDNPEQVRTLTLIEPPAVWVLKETGLIDEKTQQTLNLFSTMTKNVNENELEAFLSEVGFVKNGQSVRDLPQWKNWLPFRQSLRNNPAVVAHKDSLNRLRKFNKPILLVKGTGSATFLHKIIDVLAENIPNNKVIEMPEGHAPHIVSRDKFLSELENFQNN